MAQINTSSNDGGKVRSKKQSTKVDMAPLVDLGFLLITFFMFATTFSKPNIMNLNMPPKIDDLEKIITPPELILSNMLTIVIGGDDKLYWHQSEVKDLTPETLYDTDYSAEGIRKVITTAQSRAQDKDLFTVVIKPTDDAIYKNVVDVLDEMEITKSTKYGMKDADGKEVEVYEQKAGK